MPTDTLSQNFRFAFSAGYGPEDQPQDIRIVLTDRDGYFETALRAPDLASAEAFCVLVNATAGLDENEAQAIVARSMRPRPSPTTTQLPILTTPISQPHIDSRAIPLPSLYFFTPSQHPEHDPQQILLIFQRYPEIVRTGIATRNLHDAARFCDLANALLPPIPDDFRIPPHPSESFH